MAEKEYRKITVRLTEELYKKLKYWTVDNDTTVNAGAVRGIEWVVSQNPQTGQRRR